MRNRYDPRTPRAALRFAAVGMSALTMAVMVVLPATLGSAGTPASELTYAASTNASGATPTAAQPLPQTAERARRCRNNCGPDDSRGTNASRRAHAATNPLSNVIHDGAREYYGLDRVVTEGD